MGGAIGQTVTDKWRAFQDEIARLRTALDAKDIEIAHLRSALAEALEAACDKEDKETPERLSKGVDG